MEHLYGYTATSADERTVIFGVSEGYDVIRKKLWYLLSKVFVICMDRLYERVRTCKSGQLLPVGIVTTFVTFQECHDTGSS